jgi:hypothetical protein
MPYDVVAIRVLEYSPCLEASIDGLVAISCARLHPLIFHRVARVVRAIDLVRGTDIAVVDLDLLTRLKEMAEDLVKNIEVGEVSGWVGTLDLFQVSP